MVKTKGIHPYASGKIVVPGEKLCVVEEFMASEGTYEVNGEVRALRVGVVLYDYFSRKVRVLYPGKRAFTPKQGNIIKGKIVSVGDDTAFVKIMEIEGVKPLSGFFTGLIHVSQISTNYIKNVEEAFKLGDIIRARVLTSWPPYQLSTKYPGTGVVLAFCSNCRSPLWLKNGLLICPECNSREKRRISPKYILKL